MRVLLSGVLLGASAIAGCAGNHAQVNPAAIRLTGAPLTVNIPKGFVAADEDEVVTYPRRPMGHFHLPELPSGGTPAYPDIYIEQVLGDDSAISPDSYVNKVTARTQYHSLPLLSKSLAIDGVAAIEFAQTSEMIADFAGGGAGYAEMIDYEIVFQYNGINYHCVMEAPADDYKQYVSVFEEFCASVRFSGARN